MDSRTYNILYSLRHTNKQKWKATPSATTHTSKTAGLRPKGLSSIRKLRVSSPTTSKPSTSNWHQRRKPSILPARRKRLTSEMVGIAILLTTNSWEDMRYSLSTGRQETISNGLGSRLRLEELTGGSILSCQVSMGRTKDEGTTMAHVSIFLSWSSNYSHILKFRRSFFALTQWVAYSQAISSLSTQTWSKGT